MSKKQPRKPGRPTGRKATVQVNTRVEPTLAAALTRYVESVRPKTTERAVIEAAIEDYLSSKGFWPPPADA